MVWNPALPALRRAREAHPGARRFLGFVAGSGAGLATDLTIFTVLNALGLPATAANLVSTAVAITLTYALVTRHAFGAAASWRTYALFVAWYASSAVAVSLAIGALGAGREDQNLLWKAVFVPVTFTSNYLFSRWLFGRSARLSRVRAARRLRAERPLGRRAQRYVDVVGAHPWIASAIATTVFVLLVLPMNEAMSFGHQSEPMAVLREHGTRIAFALSLWCLLRWGIRFSVGVLERDPHYRRWLLASGAYLAVLLPLFVALYPGHWVLDEFATLYGATHFFPIAWQGYFTHVYYAFCLYLLPSKVGVVVVQMVFVSLVAGYAVTVLAARLRRPLLAGLVLLALVSPAVLLNDFYPLRLTPYAFLLLLVVTHLLRRAAEHRAAGGPRVARPAEFVAVCCAIAVLAFWRTEGVAAFLLLPVAFVVLGLGGLVRRAPQRVAAATAAALLVIGFSGWLNAATTDPVYQFTAMLNPLSTMTQGDLQGPDAAADLRTVDRVIDLAKLRTMPSYTETPALFAVGLRPHADQRFGEFARAYADLVIHNPGPFLENRWNAFLAANSQTAWAPQVAVGGIDGSDQNWVQKSTDFEKTTLFGAPWNPQLKSQTARHLFLLDSTLHPTVWTSIVWNSMLPAAAVLVTLGVALVRRRWALAACAAVVAMGAALVFLTEPAAYFMYFMPVYVVGLVAIATWAAVGADRLLRRRRAGAAAPPAVLAEPAAEQQAPAEQAPRPEREPEAVGAR